MRFNGPVAVLIGPATFSSANMLANAIKDFKPAVLIGESTAEPADDLGEIFPFMLPETHIVACGAVKMFTRATGDEKDFSGIQPDTGKARRGNEWRGRRFDRGRKMDTPSTKGLMPASILFFLLTLPLYF